MQFVLTSQPPFLPHPSLFLSFFLVVRHNSKYRNISPEFCHRTLCVVNDERTENRRLCIQISIIVSVRNLFILYSIENDWEVMSFSMWLAIEGDSKLVYCVRNPCGFCCCYGVPVLFCVLVHSLDSWHTATTRSVIPLHRCILLSSALRISTHMRQWDWHKQNWIEYTTQEKSKKTKQKYRVCRWSCANRLHISKSP